MRENGPIRDSFNYGLLTAVKADVNTGLAVSLADLKQQKLLLTNGQFLGGRSEIAMKISARVAHSQILALTQNGRRCKFTQNPLKRLLPSNLHFCKQIQYLLLAIFG